jgi:hypothetical protein
VRLYRAFPWDTNAAADQPGGAFFCPTSEQGRFDNHKIYRGLYLSRSAQGAVGERFGGYARWRPALFTDRQGRRFSLATYELPDEIAIADLDSVDMLVAQDIKRVTQVATEDRSVTQPIAARIFASSTYVGLAWWSMLHADWSNVLLWSRSGLSLVDEPDPLSIGHRAVVTAAAQLPRPILKR